LKILKTIRDIDVEDKRVLVRADFNVSLDVEGGVVDDFRIRATIPTIKLLMEGGAKIILMSHLGKPLKTQNHSLSLKPIAQRLSELINKKVILAPDCVGSEVERLVSEIAAGDVLLLENLRFHAEEEGGDADFARRLAALGEIYVNDAFAVCHRPHASVSAITKFLPSYAGLLLAKEVEVLLKVIQNPERPLVVIVGGAKISTKIKLIKKFLSVADQVIVGGALVNNILQVQGMAVGRSLVEPEAAEAIKELQLTSNKIHIPVDTVVSENTSGQAAVRLAPVGKTGQKELILDIGPETEELFSEIIAQGKTVLWNGPMGFFETPAFAHGTEAIAQAVAKASYSVIGGGETVAFVEKLGLVDKFSFVSTGGGAMLEFLSGETMPGLEALN